MLRALALQFGLALTATLSFAQFGPPPGEPWEVTITGKNGGIAYFNITLDLQFVDGYGITGEYILPFSFPQSTNYQAAVHALLCPTTANLDGHDTNTYCELFRVLEYNNIFVTNDLPVTLSGQFGGFTSLKGTFANARATYAFKANPVVGTLPSLAGTWAGDLKCKTLWLTLPSPDLIGCNITPLTEFKKSLLASQTWTFSPTAGRTGSFDITGNGTAGTNAFAVTGTVLISSKNKVAGFVQADFGDLGVVWWNFTGKASPDRGTLKLKGYDTHHGVLGRIAGLLTRQ